MHTQLPTKLLWMDLEMTGLNPDKDRIIEVAAVISDFKFNELGSYHAVVKQPPEALAGMDEWNKTTHGQSGLLAKVPGGVAEAEAEAALVELVNEHFNAPAVLAGNSIYFDRSFIKRYWPNLEAKLHYRMLDVTAWKVVMQGKFGHEFTKKETHRALDDIRESIAELKDYLGFLGKNA